jgi:hypothetical protein
VVFVRRDRDYVFSWLRASERASDGRCSPKVNVSQDFKKTGKIPVTHTVLTFEYARPFNRSRNSSIAPGQDVQGQMKRGTGNKRDRDAKAK